MAQPNFAREQELAQQGEITPLLVADFDPVLDTPTFIRSTVAYLTRRSQNTPTQIVADYVNNNPGIFGISLDGGSIVGGHEFADSSCRVIRDYVTASTGVRHLAYQQTWGGQDVFGSILSANVTADGLLVNIGSTFVPTPATPATGTPTCGAADAVAAACDSVGDSRMADIVGLIPAQSECTFNWAAGALFSGVGDTPLYVKSVFYPESRSTLSQAWLVRLPTNPASDDAAWECLIRTSDLTQLASCDLTSRFREPEPAEFTVYIDDSPVPGTPGLSSSIGNECGPDSPDNIDSECRMRCLLGLPSCGNSLGQNGRSVITITAADVLPWSPLGWLNEPRSPTSCEPSGVTRFCDATSLAVSQTCGNNARVEGLRPGFATTVGVDRKLSFALDLDADPANSIDAIVTQAFFDANVWHDQMYALGFDEVAGNFQQDNFGRGGICKDALRIQVFEASGGQYGSATPGRSLEDDGQRYLIRYSIEVGPDSVRAAALDKTVVFHELTHTMMYRLAVTRSAGQQYLGVQEGWADFFALALTSKPSDNLLSDEPVFSWPARGKGATPSYRHYYFGARGFPYSIGTYDAGSNCIDPTSTPHRINPLTFAYIDPTAAAIETHPFPPTNIGCTDVRYNPALPSSRARNEAHSMGEVWCQALFECRAALYPVYGFEANHIMMQLLVDSAKLLPGQPGMLAARDAIMQADLLRFGGEHQRYLWTAFASRGFGWGAQSPDGVYFGTHIIEDFHSSPINGSTASIFFLDEPPLSVPTCNSLTIDALVIGFQAPICEVTGQAEPNPGGLMLPADAVRLREGVYRLTMGPGQCKQAWRFWLTANAGSPDCTVLAAKVCSPRYVMAAGILETVFADDMENGANGWTTGLTSPWVAGEATLPEGAIGDQPVDPVPWYNQPARDATPGPGHLCWVTENHAAGDMSATTDDVDSDNKGSWLASPTRIQLLPSTNMIIDFQQWFASQPTITADTEDHSLHVDCILDWEVDGNSPLTGSVSYLRSPPNNNCGSGTDWWEASALRWQHRQAIAPTGTSDNPELSMTFHFLDQQPYDTIVEGGIDDVRIYQVAYCQECCNGDLNRDGNLDQSDIEYLLNIIVSGDNPAGSDPDFNHDGNTDQADIDALVNVVGGGSCP